MKQKIGIHVSVAKGLTKALEKASSMGANCAQIFSSPPRSFNPPKFTDGECAEFKKYSKVNDIGPNFLHATYLINLGSEKKDLLKKSIQSLTDDLVFAEKVGAKGSVVHTGSHKGKGFEAVLGTVVTSLKSVLAKTPSSTKVYLEIASGGKGKIGINFQELARLLEGVNDKRVGICLDTAHMFAAGFAFNTEKEVEKLSSTIEDTVSWERVEVMHANDSKVEFGSGRDRHENIGKGYINKEPFRLLLKHPKFSKIPFIMEVPGFDGKGPDKKNVEILKSLL